MRSSVRLVMTLALAFVTSFACKTGPSQEEQRVERFRSLYRSARSVEGAIAVGVSYVKFGEILQVFATELLIAKDAAKDDSDRALVAAYAEVLDVYKDSAAIWKQANESAGEEWMKGRTFVTETLQPIATKYKLPTKGRTPGRDRAYLFVRSTPMPCRRSGSWRRRRARRRMSSMRSLRDAELATWARSARALCS